MNTNRPHEELDADERELARVVRALPGNEPSPALDLRILKAAQDAAAAAPAKRTRRALWATSSAGSLWGFGTAAAAVLAVGISWQMFMRSPTSNLPSSGPAAVAENAVKDRDATSVDFIPPPKVEPSAADQVASAPASQPMLQAPKPASVAEPMRQESKPVAPLPQAFLDEHVASADEAQSETDAMKSSRDKRADAASADLAMAENAPAEKAANANAAPAVAMAPAPEQAPAAPPPMDTERREQSAMAKTTTANTGILAGGAAPAGQAAASAGGPATTESVQDAKHRVRLDARLYPESWILKIRSRLRHGDTAGARASLKLFVERYPQETVPDNLKPLLDE